MATTNCKTLDKARQYAATHHGFITEETEIRLLLFYIHTQRLPHSPVPHSRYLSIHRPDNIYYMQPPDAQAEIIPIHSR